ncbi:MAG: AAA family ATPase, partial [Candidatus Fonsibacter sp.]
MSDHFASNANEEDQNGLIQEFRQLKIANDSKFQHIPDTTKEREILYITGPLGSGKSTYTRKYLEQYVKEFKGRPCIYVLVSRRTRASTSSIQIGS